MEKRRPRCGGRPSKGVSLSRARSTARVSEHRIELAVGENAIDRSGDLLGIDLEFARNAGADVDDFDAFFVAVP